MGIYASVGIISLIVAFFSHKVRQWVLYALSRAAFVFVRRTYLHRSLGDALVSHLTKSGWKIKKMSNALYGEDMAFVRSEEDVKHVLYRDFRNATQVFYKNWKVWPIFISGTPLIQDKEKVRNYAYIVYTFRWSTDIVKELDNATEAKNDEDDDSAEKTKFVIKHVVGRQFVVEKQRDEASGKIIREDNGIVVSEKELADPFSAYELIKWNKENIGQIRVHNTLETMSLTDDMREIVDEIEFFWKSREWFDSRGVPWKRGYGLVGRPGEGKSLLVKAIAEHYNMPLIVFDLASMTNNDLISTYNQILPRRILVYEDIDNVFHGRENIISKNGVSFDCFLNVLDGVDKKQGILSFVTSNHPEHFDKALVRGGRIDRMINFTGLDYAGKMKLIMRILKDEKWAKEVIENPKYKDLSAADLQEVCCRLAIDRLFGDRRNYSVPSRSNGKITEMMS